MLTTFAWSCIAGDCFRSRQTTEAPVSSVLQPASSTTNLALSTLDQNTESLEVAIAFLEARNSWDGEAALALIAEGAVIVDAHQVSSDTTNDLVDFDMAANSSFEQATGVQFQEIDCVLGSPGRVRCEYTWENAWTRAASDFRYEGYVFVFEIEEGLVQQLTHVVAGPDDFAIEKVPEDWVIDVPHIFPRFQAWVEENHPEIDTSLMFDRFHIPNPSTDIIELWIQLSDEFAESFKDSDPGSDPDA